MCMYNLTLTFFKELVTLELPEMFEEMGFVVGIGNFLINYIITIKTNLMQKTNIVKQF